MMLIELSIIPLNKSSHTSREIADALKIIDGSGLPYRLTPSGTCIEGEWDEVMPILKECHFSIRKHVPHVVTLIHIEDEEGAKEKLTENIESVEEKAGKKLQTIQAQSENIESEMEAEPVPDATGKI